MSDNSSAEQLKELELLRREYMAAITEATDPDEKWRLYRVLKELDLAIQRLILHRDKAS
jgi:hypothetical protein